MRTFAELFRKYRLRAEFETFSDFGDALAEKGYFYEESIFSHWQKGTRIPSNRQLVLKILEVFVERKAVRTFEEANEFLASAGMGYLTVEEAKILFREEEGSSTQASQNRNLFELLNRLIFIILGVVGLVIFLIYSFVDVKNMLIFFAFSINFTLSLLLYLQSKKTPAFFAFMLTAFGISAWELAMIFYRAASSVNAILAAKLLYSFPVVIPTSFVLFGMFFSNERVNKGIVYFLIACTVVVTILTLIKDAVIVDVITSPSREKIEVYGWAYYYVYIIYFPSFFMLGYWVFIKKCLKAQGNTKMQLLHIVVGMIAGSVISLITNIFSPTLGIWDYFWIGPVATIFWVGGVYLAITKYRLLNLQTTNIFKPQ